MRCFRKNQTWPARRPDQGMTLVEIAIGIGALGLVAAGAIATLMVLNKNAVSTRIMTNAKEIVERNIEAAVGVPFSSTNIPAILALTSEVAWNDGTGTGSPPTVPIYKSRDWNDSANTGSMNIPGILYRTVTAENNTPGADIRRVKFRLVYNLYGRTLSYEMTTLRATDK